MTNIYISSTYKDLKDQRERVCRALRASGFSVTLMEEYAAADERPVKKCLEDVGNADIYIGIFGERYGYVPNEPEDNNPDGRSITELEYRQAKSQSHTACLVFLSDNEVAQIPPCQIDACTGKDPRKIRELRADLSKHNTATFFKNSDDLASQVLAAVTKHLTAASQQTAPGDNTRQKITWDTEAEGSPPYPGLWHFTPKFARVFFGRDGEIRELVDRLHDPEGRFLVVSGGSGTGKSSLVHAGLLPYLEKMGLPESGEVTCARMLPSWSPNCFGALMRALSTQAENAGVDESQVTEDLTNHPEELAKIIDKIAPKGTHTGSLLLFIDQMEELFAANTASQDFSTPFLSGLHQATRQGDLWVVATIRSDQLQPLYEHPQMLSVLNSRAHYSLGPVTPRGLHDLIVRPANCAGVEVPTGIANKLMDDIGRSPGSLPLLAFALRRLFERATEGVMSEDLYDCWGGEELGRLEGAIAEHAVEAEKQLAKSLNLDLDELEARLDSIFPKLVRVDIEGAPLRRHTELQTLNDEQRAIVLELQAEKVRLLGSEGEGEKATVSIAHERLLTAWPALAEWVDKNRGELISNAGSYIQLLQAEVAADQWRKHACEPEFLWSPRRLLELQQTIEKFSDRPVNDTLHAFVQPQTMLLERLDDINLDHEARQSISLYLTELGDPRPGVGIREDGLPDIDWMDIEGGLVVLEGKAGEEKVEDFCIARYPVTYAQFQTFVEAGDGYRDQGWWSNMPPDASDGPKPSRWSEANAPRETVSWYEATAFCRWLSVRLGPQVSLPTEFQWQQAATRGRGLETHTYPWGKKWDPRRCNSSEANLNRTTVVGLYPMGRWPGGPLDMAGNVWEWCLNKHEQADVTTVDKSNDPRVLRGGSWFDLRVDLLSGYRYRRPRRP